MWIIRDRRLQAKRIIQSRLIVKVKPNGRVNGQGKDMPPEGGAKILQVIQRLCLTVDRQTARAAALRAFGRRE